MENGLDFITMCGSSDRYWSWIIKRESNFSFTFLTLSDGYEKSRPIEDQDKKGISISKWNPIIAMETKHSLSTIAAW